MYTYYCIIAMHTATMFVRNMSGIALEQRFGGRHFNCGTQEGRCTDRQRRGSSATDRMVQSVHMVITVEET